MTELKKRKGRPYRSVWSVFREHTCRDSYPDSHTKSTWRKEEAKSTGICMESLRREEGVVGSRRKAPARRKGIPKKKRPNNYQPLDTNRLLKNGAPPPRVAVESEIRGKFWWLEEWGGVKKRDGPKRARDSDWSFGKEQGRDMWQFCARYLGWTVSSTISTPPP